MARRDDDDDYEPPRQRQAGRSGPVERKIISPRAINTYRWAMIIGTAWCGVWMFLILSGIWTFTASTSDIYLKVITMIISGLNILWAWLFPTGDSD